MQVLNNEMKQTIEKLKVYEKILRKLAEIYSGDFDFGEKVMYAVLTPYEAHFDSQFNELYSTNKEKAAELARTAVSNVLAALKEDIITEAEKLKKEYSQLEKNLKK